MCPKGYFRPVLPSLNDRKSLFRFSHRELKIAPGDAVPARLLRLLAPITQSRLARYPLLAGTVSDNVVLCQRETGFRVEMDS